MQSSSTGKPTRAQRLRFRALQELGCIACIKEGLGYRAPEIHHIVEGHRRLGHDFTLPLCAHHHRGVPFDDLMSLSEMAFFYGPSLGLSKKRFVETYGTERQLLEAVNERIGAAA